MGMGRPRKFIDWEEFGKLCAMQCTAEEIAAWFDMSREVMNDKIKEEYGCTFTQIFKVMRSKGFISLRLMQYKSAQKGSVPMQKWLGQQWLGQADKQDINQNIDHNVKHERLLRHVDNLNEQKGLKDGREEQERISESREESSGT